MKKFIAILLVVTMIFSTSAMMSFAAEEKVSFVVASDIHCDYDKIADLLNPADYEAWDKALEAYNSKEDIDVSLVAEANNLIAEINKIRAVSHTKGNAPQKYIDYATARLNEISQNKIETSLSYVKGDYSGAGQLYCEAGVIFDAFLADAAKKDAEYVILSGDLTDSGSEKSSEAMAAKLSAFENSTGKSVYVIPGNHDVKTLSSAQFKSYYNAFGYDKALAQDSNSASYTADVDGDYRLLMIDTTGAKNGGYQLDEARVNWIKAQCQQAKSEKKHIIAVMHHNMLEHFAFDFIHEGSIIDESYGLKELFCEYDVKYTFSGHTHAQDIMQYEGANGKVIYEVVGAALNAYPVSYRVVKFSDSSVDFTTESITSVETSSFEALGYDEDSIRHAKADFKGYSQLKFREGIKALFSDTICTETIKKYLDINYEDNKTVSLIVDKVGAKLEEMLHMPLYDKDKGTVSVNVQAIDGNGALLYNEENKPVMVARYSVEEIAVSYGGRMPSSCYGVYKDLLDVIVFLYESHASGGDGLLMSSDEYAVVVNGLAAALNYCLYSISEDEYGVLIRFIANKFEPTLLGKIPASIYTYMAGGKYGFEQNIIFMTYLVSPFVKNIVSDSIPSDRNVSLSPYAAYEQDTPAEPEAPQTPEEDNSFRAKFVAFFDKIADFFRMIFKVLTFQNF